MTAIFRPIPRLVLCIVLIAATFAMAFGVDAGLTHGLPAVARTLYVLAMLLGMAYAIIGGIDAIAAITSKDRTVPPVWSRGEFKAIALLSALGMGAKLIEIGGGWPFARAAPILIGAFALYLAIASPKWFEAHAILVAARAAIGGTGVRLLYGAIGAGLILAGMLDWSLSPVLR